MSGHTRRQLNVAIWVGVGGAFGSICRFLLLIGLGSVDEGFLPWGTLVANISGSFLLGCVVAHAAHATVGWRTQFFISVGALGGFTTFSFFSYENLELVRQGEPLVALVNVMGQTLVGLAAAWLGYRIIRKPHQV